MNRLDGKVALISGAARGIGAETARLMVEAGARVAIGDVLDERGRETAQAIGADQRDLPASRCDQEEEWTAAMVRRPRFGRARHPGQQCRPVSRQGHRGGEPRRMAPPLRRQPDRGISRHEVRAAGIARERPASPHGSAIVNLASVAGLVGSQLDPLYSMTKGGVTLFTKSAALEFARKGYRVRVNSIHPGVIQTDMGEQTFVTRAHNLGTNDVEAARQRHCDPSDRPARHGDRHRERHRLSRFRRCRLHDRRRACGRRRADGAISGTLRCRFAANRCSSLPPRKESLHTRWRRPHRISFYRR